MHLTTKIFTESLLNWFDLHGRKDLPWQHPQSAYRVWISEIMLQQTQVQTVLPYFLRFMDTFPDIQTLAKASIDEVLSLWSGLGYYSRARNLHRTAQLIVSECNGQFPESIQALETLPGIGPSTAAAIASLAFNQATAIMDGNVRRVLSRYFLIKDASHSIMNKQLWQQAQACMPASNCREYTQAIMDMGATCCTLKKPNCEHCPLNNHCLAYQNQLTQDYPPPKKKIIRPIRKEQFLLMHTTNNEIYLEQRPAKGLWEGLWCLPTLNIELCPKAYLETQYALHHNQDIKPLLSLKHAFTHFHLEITAKTLETNMNPLMPGRWMLASELNQIGLAKPVRTIIDYFLKERS